MSFQVSMGYIRSNARLGLAEDIRINRNTVSYAVAFLDAAVIVVCSVISGILYNYYAFNYIDSLSKYVAAGLYFALGLSLVMAAMGGYRLSQVKQLGRQFLYLAISALILCGFAAVLLFLLGIGEVFSRGAFIGFAVMTPICLALTRIFWQQQIAHGAVASMVEAKQAILVCAEKVDAADYVAKLTPYGLEFVATMVVPEDGDVRRLIHDIEKLASPSSRDVVIIGEGLSSAQLSLLCKRIGEFPIAVRFLPDEFNSKLQQMPASALGTLHFYDVQREPLTRAESFVKRLFDIVVALAALVFFAPLMLLTALAVRIDSKGPALFKQKRRGLNSVPFEIYKFRSMTVMESDGPITQATVGDVRVTRVGRFIRATSIDELPQFINVLFGSMSIVGPRPHVVAQEDEYDALISKFAFRRHIKPGITGWAQISGYRGETPTVDSMEKRLEFDLWYLHHWSLLLDIRIVLSTFISMFHRKAV